MIHALSYHIYDNYSHKPLKDVFCIYFHFLVSPWYYSIYGGSTRLSLAEILNDYYHEYYDIGNSFHDHVLIHVYVFGTISHSLQGMVTT